VSREACSVLVVEDDVMIRELIRTRLEIAGYSVAWAATGPEGLQACLHAPPRALVLDVNLPGLSGFDLLQQLQTKRRVPPPTLMLTARHAAGDVKRAIALGAKDYLTKPFDDAQLLRRVARLLRTPRQPAAAEAPSPADESLWL
jgi:two-component system OmpR family response regulator